MTAVEAIMMVGEYRSVMGWREEPVVFVASGWAWIIDIITTN
jgi:hypothetical protein